MVKIVESGLKVIKVPVCLDLPMTLSFSVVSGQNQHKVTNRSSPAPEPGAEKELIPSLVDGLRGADEWRSRLFAAWWRGTPRL